MKCETIKYDDNREIIIIDDAVSVDKRINIYFDCCTLPYRITNSSTREIQGIVDKVRGDNGLSSEIKQELVETLIKITPECELNERSKNT